MKTKLIVLCFLSIFWASGIYAQNEKNLGSVSSFVSNYLNPAQKMKVAAGESPIGQIQVSDTLTVRYKINKTEEDGAASRLYGVLQFPHIGGIFIVKNGNEIEGDIFFSNWNKALRFETRNGQVYLQEDDLTSVVCVEKEKPVVEKTLGKTAATGDQALAVDTRKLQSYPGAKAVVYIDFDGHMSGQRWANSYTGGVQFYLTPANISSDNEYTIWKVMSEDYKPFDINITTDSTIFHQYATNRRQRLVVTRNSSWQTLSSTGIAYVNGFSTGDDPAFSFPGGFSSSNPLSVSSAEKLGEVSSHEVGHTVGLSHDGSSTTSYYGGHGNWAPIMGSGYYRNVTQWSKGEYANANQLQDDLAIITKTANGFGYKADDYGNTSATAQSFIIASGGTVNAADNTGVIEQSTDIDYFKFTTTGGTVTLHFGTATPKPNLDIKASLYNSSNTLITSNDVANLTYADISTTLTAGTYYVIVEGVGYGDPLSTGYSKYASLGYYEISGTIPTSGTSNIAPTVSITSPASGATFTAPASITINATAADADGTISKVEFYNGTTLLGTSMTSPYTYAWTSVAAGTYSLTAKAYDNTGAVTTSSVVSVTVNSASNQAPTVSITSPANGTSFTAPASITINATATDADGTISKVEFYNGTTLLSTDNASPYSYSWTNVSAGTYTITAKAYDNASAVTTSSAVSITVTTGTSSCTAPVWSATTVYQGDSNLGGTGKGEIVSYNGRQYRAQWWTQNNAPGTNNVWVDLGACTAANQSPSVSITAPANGTTFTAPANISITATATDADGTISKVEFYNGTTLLGTDNASPYSFDWTNVVAGTYSLTAKAYDNNSAVTTSAAVSITVNPAPNQAPTVSITAPANGTTFTAPANISITATATDADGTISKVEFYNGTTLLGTDNASPYSFAWTGVVAGTYSLTAKAYDNSSAVTTSAAVSITVNPAPNQAPTVSITAPANGTSFTAPANISITATATDADGTISKVEFYNGTTLLGTDNASPYSFAWTGVVAGTYSLTAKAYDNNSAVTTSAAVSITVNPAPNQAPTVSITAPANGTTFTAPANISITATAIDADGTISKVEFYNGTTLLGTDNASPYSFDWTGVVAGTYSLTAKAYDNNSAVTTSAAVSITVNPAPNQTPTVSITAPANGTNFTAPANISITATATDADGTISKVEFYNGTTLLGTDNVSPYSFAWTGVVAGTYSLTAKAYDNNSAATTSAAVSITVNPVQTGTEDCSAIAAWNSASIYVKDDLVTFNGYKYKAKWWTKNNSPATNSGTYDVWALIGECISGTLAAAAPQLIMTPSSDKNLFVSDYLNLDVQGLSEGSITQVSYILYKDESAHNTFVKNGPDFSEVWNALETGNYLLQVIVKNQNGMLIYSDAINVKVSQVTDINSAFNSSSVQVIPNPNNARFHIMSNQNLKGAAIELTDMSGHKVYETTLQSDGEEITAEQLTPGVYLLKVINNDKVLMTKIQVY